MMMSNETFVVLRDDESDLRFTGVEIAHASSRKTDGPSSSRWTELTLYETNSGKLVVSRVGVTCWENESDKHSAKVCDTHADVVDYLGYGWLSKELYYYAKIEIVEDI